MGETEMAQVYSKSVDESNFGGDGGEGHGIFVDVPRLRPSQGMP